MNELRWKIGDVTVTRVEERMAPVPPAGLLPTATPEAIEKHRSWLVPMFLDNEGNLLLSIHGLVVEADGMVILVDTCIGDRPVPGYDELTADASPFLDNLASAGFSPESIDVVLCTHLHFDHVGWNTQLVDGRWVPTFPNARYLVAREEWEHWSAQENDAFAPTINEAVRPLVEGGQAQLVDTDHRICASVWLEHTPGHTPGHVAVRIASGEQEALITGDLAHHPVQWAEPSWSAIPDTDPNQSEATRRRLIAEHGDRSTLVIGTHFAPPCAGHLVTVDDATRFRPAPE